MFDKNKLKRYSRIFRGNTKLLTAFFILFVIALIPVPHKSFEGELTTNVDVQSKKILDVENTNVDWSPSAYLIFKTLTSSEIYGMLAAAGSDNVYIREGMRKEEIAELYSKKLGWTEIEKNEFLYGSEDAFEGRYFPGVYELRPVRDEEILRELMLNRFERKVLERYGTSTAQKIPIEDALIIASLIEREAGSKRDMKIISGVIWNRIFRGMTLDIDASLQYVKGNNENGWWPRVKPEDKKLDSPYNTYKNLGLPPGPISNPGLAAIEAALNPVKTDCLFYIHDRNRRIHCSQTYEGHKRNIERYLK